MFPSWPSSVDHYLMITSQPMQNATQQYGQRLQIEHNLFYFKCARLFSDFFLLLVTEDWVGLWLSGAKRFNQLTEMETEMRRSKSKYTTFSVAPWCEPSCWGDPGNTARSRPARHRVSVLAVDPWAHTHMGKHTYTEGHKSHCQL